MHQKIVFSLVQAMLNRLSGAKPSPGPILTLSIKPKQYVSITFYWNAKVTIQENQIEILSANIMATTIQSKAILCAYFVGIVQERRNSIANAVELRLSCTNPSICEIYVIQYASADVPRKCAYLRQSRSHHHGKKGYLGHWRPPPPLYISGCLSRQLAI